MIRYTYHQQLEDSYWNMALAAALPIANNQVPSSKATKGAF